MQLGMIGAGRMGGNMARCLLARGHRVVVYDRDPAQVAAVAEDGADGVTRIADIRSALQVPRVIWLMVPAGEPTEKVLHELAGGLAPGDLVVDGGNAFYKDSIRRANALNARGIHFVDAGISGGVWGRETGYCLMLGGDEQACKTLEPLLAALAPRGGYLRVGPSGAGHFAKMVHNGIEYGMLQAYAEGFALLRHAPFQFDLAHVADLWSQGSVVRSWLLELAARVFQRDPNLSSTTGDIEDSGEGRWTVREAV